MNKRTVSFNADSIWLTASQAQKHFQMSRGVLEKVSEACNAKIALGRWVRYDSRKIDGYLASIAETL